MQISCLNELYKLYNISCNNVYLKKLILNDDLLCKNIIGLLNLNNIDIDIQVIDERYKVSYLKLKSKLLLPVIHSGSSYKYSSKTFEDSDVLSLDKNIELLNKTSTILPYGYIIKYMIYDKKIEKKEIIYYNIIYIYLFNGLIIPIIKNLISETNIKKYGYALRYYLLDDEVNKFIINNVYDTYTQTRLLNLNTEKYRYEAYELFRLELSNYLKNNVDITEMITNIVRSKEYDMVYKKNEIRILLYNIVNKNLSTQFKIHVKKISNDFIYMVDTIPDLKDYNITNIRDICENYKTKNICNSSTHCIWNNNNCKMKVYKEYIIEYVNKVLEECINDSLEFKEIIQENNYHVTDILNNNIFTNREKQLIVLTSNKKINSIVNDIYGDDFGKHYLIRSPM